jgi:hypothetical protein
MTNTFISLERPGPVSALHWPDATHWRTACSKEPAPFISKVPKRVTRSLLSKAMQQIQRRDSTVSVLSFDPFSIGAGWGLMGLA